MLVCKETLCIRQRQDRDVVCIAEVHKGSCLLAALRGQDRLELSRLLSVRIVCCRTVCNRADGRSVQLDEAGDHLLRLCSLDLAEDAAVRNLGKRNCRIRCSACDIGALPVQVIRNIGERCFIGVVRREHRNQRTNLCKDLVRCTDKIYQAGMLALERSACGILCLVSCKRVRCIHKKLSSLAVHEHKVAQARCHSQPAAALSEDSRNLRNYTARQGHLPVQLAECIQRIR